jgi:hypothetical protein
LQTCCFPAQLKTTLEANPNVTVNLDIIAQTGWTTTNPKNAINTQNPSTDYDLCDLAYWREQPIPAQAIFVIRAGILELVSKAIAWLKATKTP